MAQLPASLAVAGAAVVLFGLAPRASVAGAWTVVGVLVLIALFGQVLRLAQWILDVSPFTHVPKLPGAAVTVPTTGAPLLWLSLAAAGPGRRGPGRPAPPRHPARAPGSGDRTLHTVADKLHMREKERSQGEIS